MTSERVTLAGARCVIDVEADPTPSGEPRFVARMALVEGDGGVVRPLVGPDGRRIKIHGTSERLVLRVARAYLEGRFGRIQASDTQASLGGATVGAPFVTTFPA
jgi:hypothetical protein